nr:hypothetical protein C8J56DRAFT_487733 [Mycena floridula]
MPDVGQSPVTTVQPAGQGLTIHMAGSHISAGGHVGSFNSLVQTKFVFETSTVTDEERETGRQIDEILEPRVASHARLMRLDKLELCYPGTRHNILDNIMSWISGNHSRSISRQCICIVGVPGSGKSTIAATVVSKLEGSKSPGILTAEFFIRRGIRETTNPNNIFPTIAQQLAHLSPRMANVINAVIQNSNMSLLRQLSQEQVDKLFLEPLREAPGIVVTVIDALDELVSPTLFARLLIYIIPKLPPNARLLLTTRNEHDILVNLREMIEEISLELRTSESVQDVKRYLAEKLRENLLLMFGDDPDWMSWPTPSQLESMSAKAAGLFIWASTAVKFIIDLVDIEGKRRRDEALAEVSATGMEDLDALYSFILQRALANSNSPGRLESIRRFLGFVVVSALPLTVGEIRDFLGMTTDDLDIQRFVQRARSVLIPGMNHADDTAVPQLHKTFSDFITSSVRAKDFAIDESFHHRHALHRALKSMEGLRFNICNLESSHLPNHKVEGLQDRLLQIPGHTLYACLYWANHLVLTSRENFLPLGSLKEFMKQRFLFWLEVMSLRGALSFATQSMKTLAEWISNKDHDFEIFVQDATRFIASNAQCIAYSAPHIYISALPLSPSTSVVAQHYLEQYQGTLQVQHGRKRHWDAALVIIEGHQDVVTSVSFSPNGKRVISSSFDCTIRIWNAETAAMVIGPLEGHAGWVTSARFSPDGKSIVSSSADNTIQLWDSESGDLLTDPFIGHTAGVTSVAWAPNGQQIVSGAEDFSVLVWEVATGVSRPMLWDAASHSVWTVSFSPDGKLVAATYRDGSFCVWEAATGNIALSEDGKPEWVREAGLAFSQDRLRGALRSGKDVRLWDVKTGAVIGEPFQHKGAVTCIEFSPNGQQIVTSCSDGVLCIWDTQSDNMAGTVLDLGHSDSINCVAFTPDGQEVVSASADRTICVRDAQSGHIVAGPFSGHATSVQSIAVSPNRKYIVSGSSDGLWVWNTRRGNVVARSVMKNECRSVSFSPNGQHIISGSSDGAVWIWDAKTAALVAGPARKHEASVTSIAFSPDGTRFISGSLDRTLLLWDLTRNEVTGPFEGHEGSIFSVAFCRDGKRIASGSDDRTLRIWDLAGVELVKPFIGHTAAVFSIAFSPDGTHIVSGSGDGMLRIWDTQTGHIVAGPFRGHTDSIYSVAFSPNGETVVTGSGDRSLRFWDTSLHQRSSTAHSKDVSTPTSAFQDESEIINGWVMTRNSGLLFWVPPVYRANLWRPSNTLIIGQDVLRLNLEDFVHGKDWMQCHSAHRRISFEEPTVSRRFQRFRDFYNKSRVRFGRCLCTHDTMG